jgi:hypothetical protein
MTRTKSIVLVVLAGLLGVGCIPAGASPGASFADSSQAGPSFDASSSSQDSGPQMVIPATGGAPVMATPVGGDMYVPVTGGAPIVGIGT